jgi:hypothetical protein
MLQKDQAERVAEGLLQQARDSRASKLNAKVRPVPFYLKVPEFAGYEPAERAAFVLAAARLVERKLSFQLAVIGWLCLCGCMWYFLVGPRSAVSTATFVFVVAAGVFAIRTAFTRKALRLLAGRPRRSLEP